jgi:hypothetical protein
MNREITFAMFAVALSAGTLAAQSGGMKDKPHDLGKMSMERMPADSTYTGCLRAGSAPGSFILKNAEPMTEKSMDQMAKTNDGMGDRMMPATLSLTGTSVDFKKHVGQKVTVVGSSAPAMKDAMGKEQFAFTVKTLKTTAKSCS